MDVQENNKSVERKDRKLVSSPTNKATEGKLKVFLEHYIKNGRIIKACEAAGMAFDTHYRLLRTDADYRAAFEEAEQGAAQQIEDALFSKAVEGDVQAAQILLKRFRPDAYRERVSADITVTLDLAQRLTTARARLLEM